MGKKVLNASKNEIMHAVIAALPEQANNPLPVFCIDATGAITQANPAANQWLQEQPQDSSLPTSLQKALNNPLSNTRLSGQTFTFTAVPGAESNTYYLYGWPASSEVLSREVLLAANQSALRTASTLGEGMLLCDMNGTVQEVNDAFLEMTASDSDDILQRKIQDVLVDILQADHQKLNAFIADALLQKNPRTEVAPMPVIAKDSKKARWVVPCCSNIYGGKQAPLGVVFILCDVTHLMRTEKKLRESEQSYRELVENVNNIIFRVSLDLSVRFVNKYALDFFGLQAEEVINSSFIDSIFPAESHESGNPQQSWQDIIKNPELHGVTVSRNVRSNGDRVWIQWNNRAIRDDDGNVKELLCVGTDITYRKQLEEQSSRDHKRLHQLSQTLAKTEEHERRQLASQLHDTAIQTLSLASMRLGALLQDKEIQTTGKHASLDSAKKLLEDGIQECRHILTGLTPPLLHEAGLIPALKDFIEKQEERVKCDFTLNVDDDMDDYLREHRGIMFQCCRELLMNALKHAQPSRVDTQLKIDKTNNLLHISVEDNGIGFDVEILDHPEHIMGGFGMFNIKQRLLGIHGTVTVHSRPNEGTIVDIKIPLHS